MTPDELTVPFRDFVRVFEHMQLPYALIGGLAVGVHGIPRPTHDLDFTIAVDREQLREVFAAVTDLGYDVPHQPAPSSSADTCYKAVTDLGYDVPQEFASGWVNQVAGMPLVRARNWLRGKAIDVDLFLAESPFQESLIQRRIETTVDGIHAWIASPEDIILLKLLASRPLDIGDVQDILLVQGQLDEQYLRHWADALGVRQQLEKAIEEFSR